ncbi:response regulator transcription factor [Cellulophaga baltica]|uniref:response regulator transcription factor n=1 Tax=Cellulophaga TaxID=104264 RepID=UPI001C07D19F|nr:MULTISPECIES: response regulator transcription factor [Cellulophaga]MBU2997159.1 response regulator transcription factor [Cellulophaga baltica]MDO6768557.1 response regulator transcription factor [Cellulophaga sp. 1_MG-2023]
MKSSNLKIMVIDSDLSFHQNYQTYFNNYVDYSLAGMYTSVNGALLHYNEVQPNIILTEVAGADVDGIEAIHQFKKLDPSVKVVMLSTNNDFELVKKAFKNGANGYLSKPINEHRLYSALEGVKEEGAAISSDIAKKIMAMFQRKNYASFSKRENQIIDFLSQGGTYKSIAESLFITASAVNFHIQNIYLKLNVNSKSEALIKLRELEAF